MRALTLDYASNARRSRLVLLALAAFSGVFACDSAIRYRDLSREVHEKQVAVAKHVRIRPEAPTARAVTPDELAVARETARKLAVPWNSLFQGLGAAKTDEVFVLAIEPDAETRTVVLTAEARDYGAALAYVANLAQQPGFARVHLSRHELKAGSAQRGVTFMVSASWKGAR